MISFLFIMLYVGFPFTLVAYIISRCPKCLIYFIFTYGNSNQILGMVYFGYLNLSYPILWTQFIGYLKL